MLSDLTQCSYCQRDFTYRIFRLARLLNIPRGIMVNLFVSKSLNKELYRMKKKLDIILAVCNIFHFSSGSTVKRGN